MSVSACISDRNSGRELEDGTMGWIASIRIDDVVGGIGRSL